MIPIAVAMILLALAVRAVKRRRARVGGLLRRGTVRRTPALMMTIVVLAVQMVISSPSAFAATCGTPNPEYPNSGFVGILDPVSGNGDGYRGYFEKGVQYPGYQNAQPGPNDYYSRYLEYGYAGMVWKVYRTDCNNPIGMLADSGSDLDNWFGNKFFDVAKVLVATTNGLDHLVSFNFSAAGEQSLNNPLEQLNMIIKNGTDKVYSNIYAQLLGLIALILAIAMFRRIWKGDLAGVSKKALFAFGAMWLAASSLVVVKYFPDIDRAIIGSTSQIKSGFIQPLQNDPPYVRQVCPGGKCEDLDMPATKAVPVLLQDEVVYKNWLRGQFGTASDEKILNTYGPQFLHDLAWEKSYVNAGMPDAGEKQGDNCTKPGQICARSDNYKAMVDSADFQQYKDVFVGNQGNRAGAGLLAFAQSLMYSLFQLVANLAIFLAQVLVRVFVLAAPLIGLAAMLKNDLLLRVGKAAATVVVNLLILSTLAGIQALLLHAILTSSMDLLPQMALALLLTVLLFIGAHPVRRLRQIVQAPVSEFGGVLPAGSGGIFSKFRKVPNEDTPQEKFWKEARTADDSLEVGSRGPVGAIAGGGRYRPEARNSNFVVADARRLDRRNPESVAGDSSRRSVSGGSSATLIGRSGQPIDSSSSSYSSELVEGPSARFERNSEPVVIASKMGSDAAAPIRRVEPEMVNGGAVYSVYSPKRGVVVLGDQQARPARKRETGPLSTDELFD